MPTLFNLAVHLLVQVADRRGAYAGAPQELGDVLHAAHGYASMRDSFTDDSLRR